MSQLNVRISRLHRRTIEQVALVSDERLLTGRLILPWNGGDERIAAVPTSPDRMMIRMEALWFACRLNPSCRCRQCYYPPVILAKGPFQVGLHGAVRRSK
jgi:hypothetical protein